MSGGGTGKTCQSLPVLGVVPAGLEAIKPIISSEWRYKMLGECSQQLWPQHPGELRGVAVPVSWGPQKQAGQPHSLDRKKLTLFWVLPVTPAAELLTKHGRERHLGSCGNFGTGGSGAKWLYVFPKAAAASVAELSPSTEQPGLGWEHSQQQRSTKGVNWS